MPYTLNKSNGTVLTDILDNSVDRITTDLALIGKNTANYGELFNENFIKLLENFANDEPPRSPITGQFWFDTSDNSLKLYDGNKFTEFAKPIISSTQPINSSAGDFWFDTQRRQLYFNDGNGLRLAGPIYTAQQGVSGFEIVTIQDVTGGNHIVAKLKLGNILIGIFCNDTMDGLSAGTPLPDYSSGEGIVLNSEGISGPIVKGFTPVSREDFRFDVIATKALKLVDEFGQEISVDQFVKVTGDNLIDGRLGISGINSTNSSDLLNIPISLGAGPNLNIEVQQEAPGSTIQYPVRLRNLKANQNFVITVKDNSNNNDAIFINAETSRVGVFTTAPTETLDIAGNTQFRGNLKSPNLEIDIFKENVITANILETATDISIGATTGNTIINNNATVSKVLTLSGQNLISTNTVFNLLHTGTQTINFGDQATSINVGANNGNVTFRNDLTVDGDLSIQGIFTIDNVTIRNNEVLSTGNFDLNLGVSEPTRQVKFINRTTATQDLTVEQELTFTNLGKLRTSPGFVGTFSLLNENTTTIAFGGETSNINIGNPVGLAPNTNIISKLVAKKEILVGDDLGSPAFIKSRGTVGNLYNTSTTVNVGEFSETINIFKPIVAGDPIKRANIYASETTLEGNLYINGVGSGSPGSVTIDSNLATIANIFNGVDEINLGIGAGSMTLGGPSWSSSNTVITSPILRVGITGQSFIIEAGETGDGTKKVFLKTSTNVEQLGIAEQYVDRIFLGSSAERIEIGANPDFTEVDFNATQPIFDTITEPQPGGAPDIIRSQFPVVIIRKNLVIRNRLILPNLPQGGLLFKNEHNEIISVAGIRGSTNSNLTVNGNITLGGSLTGATGNVQILSPEFTADAKFNGNLISSDAVKNLFTANVQTLNIGGAAGSVINLASSTSSIRALGRFRPSWKSIIADQDYSAYPGDRLLVDTYLGPLTISLPPSVINPVAPIPGDEIRIVDQRGYFNINSVFVAFNGKKYNGTVVVNTELNTLGTAVTFLYTGEERGWVLI